MGQHGQGMVKRPDELRSSMTISGLNDEQNKQNVGNKRWWLYMDAPLLLSCINVLAAVINLLQNYYSKPFKVNKVKQNVLQNY